VSARTILTMASGIGIDLNAVRVEDIDFMVLAEHLGKEKRFNGATPNVEYSVAQHQSIGYDAIRDAGGTDLEMAAFLIHDCHEAIWKDDPTPKKVTIVERIARRCGVLAEDIVAVLDEIVDEHNAAIYHAAGLPWPLPQDVQETVKRFDKIMFVTEWRDLMHDIPHPHWAPYIGITPLAKTIQSQSWRDAAESWYWRASCTLPTLIEKSPRFAHNKTQSEHAGTST
jgi:hypothetical protein